MWTRAKMVATITEVIRLKRVLTEMSPTAYEGRDNVRAKISNLQCAIAREMDRRSRTGYQGVK